MCGEVAFLKLVYKYHVSDNTGALELQVQLLFLVWYLPGRGKDHFVVYLHSFLRKGVSLGYLGLN